MPSSSKQKKKQLKAQLQNSPLSSNATTVPSKTQQPQAQEHASLCEEASRKFPSLIVESAIVAKIIHDDDTVPLFKDFSIWLSEPSMLSSSLFPDSIVSVSIPSSNEKSPQLHSFPLVSLANECAKCHGLEIGKEVDDDDDDVGNYFVLATMFPASFEGWSTPVFKPLLYYGRSSYGLKCVCLCITETTLAYSCQWEQSTTLYGK